MSPALKAAIVHILIVAASIAATVSALAALLPKTSVPAGWLVVITGAAGLVTTIVHALLGYFGPTQPPAISQQKTG